MGHTTLAVSEENKAELDDVAESAFGNRNASYDSTVGFLARIYKNTEMKVEEISGGINE